jgi:hypothetical protein
MAEITDWEINQSNTKSANSIHIQAECYSQKWTKGVAWPGLAFADLEPSEPLRPP